MTQSGLVASSSPYNQPMNNNSSLMGAQAQPYSMTPTTVNSSTGNQLLLRPTLSSSALLSGM